MDDPSVLEVIEKMKQIYDVSAYAKLVAPVIEQHGVWLDYHALVYQLGPDLRKQIRLLTNEIVPFDKGLIDLDFRSEKSVTQWISERNLPVHGNGLTNLVSDDRDVNVVVHTISEIHKLTKAADFSRLFTGKNELDDGYLKMFTTINSYRSLNTRASASHSKVFALSKHYKPYLVSGYTDFPELLEVDWQSGEIFMLMKHSRDQNLAHDMYLDGGIYTFLATVLSRGEQPDKALVKTVKVALIAMTYGGSDSTIASLLLRSPQVTQQDAVDFVAFLKERYQQALLYLYRIKRSSYVWLLGKQTTFSSQGIPQNTVGNAAVASSVATLVKLVAGLIAEDCSMQMQPYLTVHDAVYIAHKLGEEQQAAEIVTHYFNKAATLLQLDIEGIQLHKKKIGIGKNYGSRN